MEAEAAVRGITITAEGPYPVSTTTGHAVGVHGIIVSLQMGERTVARAMIWVQSDWLYLDGVEVIQEKGPTLALARRYDQQVRRETIQTEEPPCPT